MYLLEIFAQVAAPAAETSLNGNYVISLVTAIIGAVLGAVGRGAVQKRDVGPQPFEVKEHREPTWVEVAELTRRIEALESEQRRQREEMVAQYKEITLSAERRASRLMGALNSECKEIREAMAKNAAELNKQVYLLVGGNKA